MGSIADDVAAAKASFSPNLASAKQDAAITIAEAKSSLLQESVPSPLSQHLQRQRFSDIAIKARKEFLESLPDPKRVIKTENNIQFLADGTFNLISATGEILRNISKKELPDLLRIEEGRLKDLEKQERLGMKATPLTGLGAVGVDVTGKIIGGAAEIGSDITQIGTPAQTLTEEVDRYNQSFAHERSKATISESMRLDKEPPPNLISKEELAKYQKVKKAMREDAPLSAADTEYVNTSEKFNTIAGLESKVHRSSKTYDKIEEISKDIQSHIPTKHADDIAVSLAYKRVAKEEGIPAALWRTLTQDWQHLVQQGFESIPYMIAFTAGGPITQAGVLYTLAVSKAREITTTFMKEHDRDPDTNERMRIEFFAGASTVAEKFGDMAAVRAIPFAKFGRATGILKQITDTSSDAVKKAISKTSFTSKVGKGLGNTALALGGEGVSGGLTATFDQLAAAGKITDPAQIGFDALAEAVGTVGGLGGMVAGKALYNTAKLPFTPSREERRIQEELAYLDKAIASEKPIKVKDTGQGQPIQDEIDTLNEGLENIKDPEQRKIKLEQIRQNLSKAGKDDSEAEAILEEYIAGDTKRRDELTAALEKVLPKEVFEKRKAAILAEQKERQESKAKKKLLKTKEGKEARIAEIDKEIEAVRAKEGFIDAEAIRKLEEEKQGLTEGLDSFATKIKRTFVGDVDPRFEDPQEPVDDRTYTPLEDAEFNKLVKSIDVEKLTDPATDPAELDEALNKIAEIHKYKELTDSQDQILSKIKDELAEVDPRFKEGPLTSIKGVVNATEEQLKKQLRIAKKNKKTEDIKLINAELKRKVKQAELKKIENQKTMGEVHSQVVDGPGTRWKGIHTYYDEIVKTVAEIKDKVIAEDAVINIIQRMSTHVGNLKRKQEAFTAAYNKPTLKKGIRVVRGTAGEGRVMKYTEEVMSVKAFRAARKKNEYVTAIFKEKKKGFGYTSEGLIKKVGLEVEYGNEFLTVVEGFRETSFSRAAAELDARRKALKEKQAKAAKVRFKLKKALILNKKTQDSLDALFKTKSNKELQKYIIEKREEIKQLKNISEKAQEEAVLAYAVLAFNARTPEKKKKKEKESKPKPGTAFSNEKVWPIKRLKKSIATLQGQIDKATNPKAIWQKNIDSMTAELERRGVDVKGEASITKKLLLEAKKTFDAFTGIIEELNNKKVGVIDSDKTQALAQASSTSLNPTIVLNIKAIVEDFQNDMAYLDGKGEGIHANTSRQKAEVFKNVDVPAFKKFIRDNGGIAAYINFIYQHEKSHIINKDGAKYPKKKDGTTDIMHADSIAIERSANAYAFEKIGFKAAETTKSESKTRFGKVTYWKGKWTVKDIQKNSNKIFIFGDNLLKKGKLGQAIIRELMNAFGIPTKKAPSTTTDSYFTDDELEDNKLYINAAFLKIETGKDIFLPQAGLGTGLAKLAEKAPETLKYIQSILSYMEENSELPPYVERKAKLEVIQNYAKRMITEFIPKTAREKHLKKELLKAKVATQFIGAGKQHSSTDVYREIYDRIGLANTGEYTSKDTIFIASNGNRYGRVIPVGTNGKLRGVYTNVDLAIEAGATIIMDTAGHLADSNYNVGEMELAEYLKKKEYVRQGKTGVWKKQPAKGEQGTKTLTEADIKILREHKWQPFDPGPDEVPTALFSDAEIESYIKDPSQIQRDITSLTPLASLEPDWEKRRLQKIKNDTLAVDIDKANAKIDVLKSLSVMKEEKTPPTEVEHYKGSSKELVFSTIKELIEGLSKSSAKKAKWISTWFGPIAYEYSGGNEIINHPAQEMPEKFAKIARGLEGKLGYPEGYFNSALMNVFPKEVGIGKHADDEEIYGADDQEQTIGAVATVSLGGTSVVKITSNDGKKQWNLKIEDGDVYIMPGGNFQRTHKHQVGKSSSPRISMTFRHVPKNRITEQQDPIEHPDAKVLNAAKNVTLGNVLELLKSLTHKLKDSDERIHVSDEYKKAYENVLIKFTTLVEKKVEKESNASLMFGITEMEEQKAPEGNENWNYEVLPALDVVRVAWRVVWKELAKRKKLQDKKTNFKGLKAEDIIPDGFIESLSEDYGPTKEAPTEDKTQYGKLTPEIVKGFNSAQDAVEWLIDNTDNPLYRRFAQRIKDSIPNIPIRFIDKDYITAEDGSRARGVATRRYEDLEDGLFTTSTGISLARSGVNESTLLHELFHVAVAVLFSGPITLKQKAAKQQLLDIATHLKTVIDSNEIKGMQLNPDQITLLDLMRGLEVPGDEKTKSNAAVEELITYALTNQQARALMMSLPALETGYKSLWSEFVIAIRKLMGMEDTEKYPPTLFDQIVESTDILIEKPEAKKTKQKPISRHLPKESQSKQAFYVLYPEILTKDGILAEDSVLAKHFEILESLATALGLKSPAFAWNKDKQSYSYERKDIEAALKALPDNKDFLEAKIETRQLETTITEEQLKKAKTKQHASIGKKSEKSIAERIAENLENVFGILGVYVNKLITIRKIRDKKALNGIHTLPDAVFEDTHAFSGLPITDASGKKQYKTLERALIALGVSEEGAAELVEEYSRYARKYEAIRVDGRVLDTEGNPQGNTAINKPLSILYSEDQNVTEFPPQIIFGMMLGTVTWLQQNPTNIRFKSDLGREIFLYGDHAQLSPSERGQVKNVGHSYTEAVSTVGNNIISILKISGKDLDTDVYYNNLSIALGQLALQVEHGPQELTLTDKTSYTQPTVEFEGDESRLHIEGKLWNFKPAKKEGRIFNNADKKPYKHIKLNLKKTSDGKETPLKLPKATVDASKEILAVIDADVDTEGGKPAQKPFPKVVDNIKNSLGGVANEIKDVLSVLQGNDEKQHVSWTGTQSLDIAVKLDEAGEKDALYKLAGVEHVDDTYHIVRRESIEASNADKTNAIDGLLDAYNHEDGNLLKKFYFRYKLQIQNRIMMQSSGTINPQASGVDRYYVRPTKASVKYTEKDLWKFKLSVVGNFGFEIDKNDLTSALDAFDYLIADGDVLEAVSAIQNIDEAGQPAKLAKLLLIIKNKEVLGEADHPSSILNGLTGLAQGLTVGSNVTEAGESVKATKLGILKTDFESDVVLEIDGISSGFAQNALQFPMYGKEGNELRRNQTGTYIGPTESSTTHDPYKQDIYQDVGTKVEEYSGVDTAESFHLGQKNKKPFNRDQYIARNNSLNELYPTLKNGDMRKLIKYPFLIFMYGGGPKSISEGIAGDILSELYVQLDLHQRRYHKLKTQKAKNAYLKEKVLPFLEHLRVVGAIDNVAIFRGAFVNPKKVKEELLKDAVAISRISILLRPRLQLGLESILLGTKDARDAAIQAGEVLHAVFMAHFEKAQEEALIIRNENGEDTGQRRPNLTEKEINELIRKELISLLPQYKGPLQQTDQSFIDLTKRQSSESDSTSEMVTIEYKDPKNKRGIGTASTTPKRMTFTSPGVSALIRMIINMDAAILTKTLAAHPHVLMLHDAVMGDPNTLEAANTTYGKWYVKLNREYSVLDSITKRMNAVIAKTEAKDIENGNNNLMEAVDSWLIDKAFINQYAKSSDIKSREVIVQRINDVNKTVQIERKKVEEEISERGGRVISSQLYMARKPIFEATQIILDKEKNLRLKISNLVDLVFKDVPKDVRNTPSEFEKEEQAISEAFRKEIKKAKKGKGLFYSSLPDQKRDNPITKLVGDITKENILSTFADMQEHSENYYENDQDQTRHAETLLRVLTKLADGLKDSSAIRFTQEEIDGITQGEFDPVSKRVRVSLSRQGPLSTNAQSPQEVYVHELVHAIVTVALDKNPLLRRRIEKLYRQTKQDLAANDGYKIFLNDPKSKDEQAKRTAKEQYEFLFTNPKNEKHKLGEFLAYAVTNRQLVNYLSGTKTKIHYKYRKEETLFTRAIDVFEYFVELAVDTVLRAFNKRGGFGAKANHEMLAVLEALINIQSNNRNRLERLQDKLYKNLGDSDQFLRKFGDEQALAIIESEPAGFLKRVGRVAVGAGYLAISKNAQTLKTRQIVYNAMGDTLRHLALEVGEGILGKRLIQQLLFSKVNVSKARQEAERFTIKWFNGIWKSVDASKPKGMSVDLRENLTNVIFRTDLSSLLNMGLSHAEIASFIGDRSKIDARLKYLEKQILNKRPAKRKYINHAVDYAKELGEYMASGDVGLEVAHMNAFTIARKYLAKPEAGDLALIEAYATLTALKATRYDETAAVKELVDAEFAVDATQNGFIDLLDSHIEFVDRSRKGNFGGNPTQMVKGYIVERIDNLTDMKVGLETQRKDMENEGYPEMYGLGDIPGLKPGQRINDKIFIGRNAPPIPYVSAIMSTTNKRNIGTTLTEILSESPNYQKSPGVPDMAKIKQAIRDIHKEQEKLASRRKLKFNNELRLRPVLDEKENVTDYRVIMNHVTRKQLLNPDLEIQNVFAHMQSSYIDRVATIKNDKRTIELLVYEQKERLPSHRDEFIDFLDPANGFIDRYYRLPKEVRMYMDRFTKDGKFMVRKDAVNKIFGYQARDLRNIPGLNHPSMVHIKRFAGLFHYILRQIIGYGKDRIVIAMPQVWLYNAYSNIAQLMMRNIPLPYIIHKTIEGFHEYQAYRNDTEERRELKNTINIKNLDKKNSPEAIQVAALTVRIEGNKIHAMSAAGLNSLIVEDLNDASLDGYINRGRRYLKTNKWYNASDRLSTTGHSVAANIFMTRSTGPYQVMRQIVQMTDFLGRYVMMQHAMEIRGLDFNTAMHEALDAFVLFDEALAPALESLESLGATVFLSYFLRNQRSARQVAMRNPTGVAISGAFQYSTGIPTLGNLDSAFIAGDIMPTTMYLDELFDEANNPTGADLLNQALGDIFS